MIAEALSAVANPETIKAVIQEKVSEMKDINNLKDLNETKDLATENYSENLNNADGVNETLNYDNIDLQNKISMQLNSEGIQNIRESYPNVENTLGKLEKELNDTPGSLELQKIDKTIETYKGTVFEDIGKEGLKDKFELVENKQRLVETDQGLTKPDMIMKDAKESFQISDLEIHRGDDLSAEVKCGEPEYLKSEIENGHIFNQVEGHEGQSLVIVSKDYMDLDSTIRSKFEQELSERGSHLYVSDVYSGQVSDAIRANLMGA
jgi:hypothetical protein